MTIPIKLLDSKLFVSWKLDDLLKKFIAEVQLPGSGQRNMPYFDPSGQPHWQTYKEKIGFARNFGRNFKLECMEVVEKLKIIQSELSDEEIQDNYLLKIFKAANLKWQAVSLIKVDSQYDVALHTDHTRDAAINIGLQNSDLHQTLVSHDLDINKFNNSEKSSYTLSDGDVVIVDIKHPHLVRSLNKNINKTRYLITYNITNP